MKRHASIVFGAGLLAATVFANASNGQLAQVTVHQDTFAAAECTPPNDSQDCADFHAAIRRHFSTREIGMLFGPATAYQEYPTKYASVRARYAAFLRNIDENGLAVAVAAR